MTIKTNEVTGYSESSLDAAIENAREQSHAPERVEVIETRSSIFDGEAASQYQVTLSSLSEVEPKAE